MDLPGLKERLVYYSHKVYEMGFVSATDGNLSLRVDADSILITPSSKNKGELRESDLLLISNSGVLIEGSGKISTENKIHLLAYNRRQDVNAVVHCHPVYATAFAATGEGFEKPVFPEVVLTMGKVPLCKYGTPSTDELPMSLIPHIDYCSALLLENHGAVTVGKSIKDAYYKMEKLEHTAHTLFVTRQLGREKTIPLYKVKELYDIAESAYGIKIDKRNKFGF